MNSTQVRYHRRRLADVAQAMRLARTQTRREQQPRARLAQHQQRRLETVVRHAAAHSPFYRRWLTETGALGNQPTGTGADASDAAHATSRSSNVPAVDAGSIPTDSR